MKELKLINPSERSFPANGKTYFIEAGDISIARWSKYEELILEMQYGVTQVEMFNKFKEITELANKLQFADIAILAYNVQNGMRGLMQRQPVALKICALFINEENEDRGSISDDIIAQKIDDWNIEGYAVGPFFQLALVFSRLTGESSSMLSPQFLEEMQLQLLEHYNKPIAE